jgi:hypothetical protein
MRRPWTSFPLTLGVLGVFAALASSACRDATIADEPADAGAVAAVDAGAAAPVATSTTTPTATSASTPAGTAPAADLRAIRGAQPGVVDMASWFAARQVDRAALVAFLGSHGGSKIESSRCQAVSVGAPAEPALVCIDPRADHDHVQLLVVRNGAPAIVAGLFVSYFSSTEPKNRFVDLAVTMAQDGLSFTLDDRGPPGLGCDQARDRWADAAADIGKGVAKLCADRGRWTWSANGHFIRPSHAKN